MGVGLRQRRWSGSLGRIFTTASFHMTYRLAPHVAVPLIVVLAGCATHAPADTPTAGAGATKQPTTTTARQTQPQSTNGSNEHGAGESTPASVNGRDAAGFARWVAGFEQRAKAKGISSATLNTAFADAEFLPHVIELDNRQPEFNQRDLGLSGYGGLCHAYHPRPRETGDRSAHRGPGRGPLRRAGGGDRRDLGHGKQLRLEFRPLRDDRCAGDAGLRRPA